MVATSATPAAGERVQRIFREIETELGFGIVPNVFRSMAANPAVLAAHWGMFKYTILDGELPRAVKEMVGVVVSTVNNSEYAAKVHLHSLGVQGVNEAILAILAGGGTAAEGLPAATCAMLTFAQRVAQDRAAVSGDAMRDLEAAGFTPEECREIVGSRA